MTAPAALARRALASLIAFPTYGAIALTEPPEGIEVWLHGPDTSINVTNNNSVVALRPFTIGIASRQEFAGQEWRLSMRDASTARELGVLQLTPTQSIPLAAQRLHLFEMAGSTNLVVARASLEAYYLRERYRAYWRQRRFKYNFLMTPGDIRASHVFYICPRPVVLVSVEHEGTGNLFPMDLIGPTASSRFTMALRLTSPSVALMQQSRRMALSSVPFSCKQIAYDLGKHHSATEPIDWAGLPFALGRSREFGLPVPAAAPRVREVYVEECQRVGSHMLFLTSIVSDTVSSSSEKLLFHCFYKKPR